MDETDDVFNDDTFGGGDSSVGTQKPVGKDFDFFGQTAKVADAISEEQMRFSRHQPAPRTVHATSTLTSQQYNKPAKSGYERYQEPGYLRDLQADDSIWGEAPRKPTQPANAQPSGGRKMMSLEEVEAAMRAQAKKSSQPQAVPQQQMSEPALHFPQQPLPQQYQGYPQHPQHQQYPPPHQDFPIDHEFARHTPPTQTQQQPPVQILQRSQHSHTPSNPNVVQAPKPLPQQVPVQILQNPNRLSGQNQILQQPMPPIAGSHGSHVITHPQQLAGLSDEARAAFLVEDAKRAKRNHKIFLMSKDNGLMTPQDKNFITRIQLQQLVTATGNPNEQGADSALAEDFYYQVHNQIRGGPRQNPNQPLSNFAQTYLFQTGGRHGHMRRQGRGGDNHVQRMEQQVQRAVEAAKNKPKNKQLVIEGSLGKISFSNAKTPKPLLNIKRADDAERHNNARVHQASITGDDRKTVLRSIESVYDTLMQMEDHDRQMPPPLMPDDINPALVGLQMDWREKADKLNEQLWHQLKVLEPVGATATHPFIAFLSFAKGKKAIPRIFRHINQEQRTTILTMIVVHLDQLDVIRDAHLSSGEIQLNASIRENIELFSLAVMPSLFGYLNEAGLNIVDGVLGIIVDRTNLGIVARTRIGVSMLTMILSRAELIKQGGSENEQEWEHW